MEIGCLPFNKTGVFSSLMEDYVSQAAGLRSFYGNSPDVAGLNAQRTLKKAVFTQAQRTVLQDVLREQYQDLKAVDVVEKQIELLGDAKTTTVVTGHQLNLFSGPLYFLYKIISVINLAEALSDQKTLGAVVPVYWMATEDHDFEEINFFKVKGVKLQWTPEHKISGPVGRYGTKGLEAILPALEALLGTHKNAQYLLNLFEDAYVKQPTLAKATRYFAHTLFGDKGLVVIDGDHPALKKMLIPHIEKDLFEQLAYHKVTQTAQSLIKEGYHVQVNPRPINYFYMEDGLRERIVAVEGCFEVLNTKKFFTPLEMKAHIASNPENFSPNVIARPLYQELILPNIAYTGGGGELAYWLELKDYFDSHGVLFPVLMLRNSALLMSEKQLHKWRKMGLTTEDLFLKRDPLINKKIRAISNIELDLSAFRDQLHKQFLSLQQLAQETDASFLGAVQAQEVKQLKGINSLEKKLLLAQKRKLKDQVARLSQLHESLFPGQSLQERSTNFSEFYAQYGSQLLHTLQKELDPLKNGFSVISL